MSNNQNQPKPETTNPEEIELDENALEEVTGGTQVDVFFKYNNSFKFLPAVQAPFTGGVKPNIDPNLHK